MRGSCTCQIDDRMADFIKSKIPGVMLYKGMQPLSGGRNFPYHHCVFVDESMVDKIEHGTRLKSDDSTPSKKRRLTTTPVESVEPMLPVTNDLTSQNTNTQ